jgi:hypothetical protein
MSTGIDDFTNAPAVRMPRRRLDAARVLAAARVVCAAAADVCDASTEQLAQAPLLVILGVMSLVDGPRTQGREQAPAGNLVTA